MYVNNKTKFLKEEPPLTTHQPPNLPQWDVFLFLPNSSSYTNVSYKTLVFQASKQASKRMLSIILFTGSGSIFPVWDLRSWQSSNTRSAGWRWKSERLGPLFFSPNFVFYKGQREPKGLGGKGCSGEGGRPQNRSRFDVNLPSWYVLSVQPAPRGRDLSAGVQDSRGNSCLTIKEQRKLGAEGEQEASVATLSLCCNSSLSEPVSLPFRVPWGNWCGKN